MVAPTFYYVPLAAEALLLLAPKSNTKRAVITALRRRQTFQALLHSLQNTSQDNPY